MSETHKERDSEIERMTRALRDLKDHSVKQQGELDRLRRALEYYADATNWSKDGVLDFGGAARAVLEGE